MHETLPCYLVLEVGAKLAKCFRGHLRAPHAISCISCVLLYDWPSHLREQINRTFQFRNCHGKFFCSFWCIHGNNPRAVSVWEKRLHTKKSFPVGKRYLPMGKRASITTTNISHLSNYIPELLPVLLPKNSSFLLIVSCFQFDCKRMPQNKIGFHHEARVWDGLQS